MYRSRGWIAPVGEQLDHLVLDERSFQRIWFDHYQIKGRLVEVCHNDYGPKINIWLIPYWSIVIPLTLLSAWLLLSKAARPKSSIENRITSTTEHHRLG
jgi:hypothetical protein